MTARPQDFKSKAREAISLQAANLLQKRQLDLLATKIILVLKAIKDPEFVAHMQSLDGSMTVAGADEYLGAMHAEIALNAIAKAVHMTREEADAARQSFVYPDERIQAVLDRATEEIAAILLDDVG